MKSIRLTKLCHFSKKREQKRQDPSNKSKVQGRKRHTRGKNNKRKRAERKEEEKRMENERREEENRREYDRAVCKSEENYMDFVVPALKRFKLF